jgi:hypothetical protein
MPDPVLYVAAAAVCAFAAAYGAIVFHGLWLTDRPFVQRARGIIAHRYMHHPWTRQFLLPGLPAMLPGGLGGLLGVVGVMITGRPVRFERIPGSIGDDLVVIGTALIGLAMVILLTQPDRLRPGWYRAELRLAEEGSASGLPPARPWTELATTPTRTVILAIAGISCVVAVFAFSVPLIWIALAVLVVAGAGERLRRSE